MTSRNQELTLKSSPNDPEKYERMFSASLALFGNLNSLLQLSSAEFDRACDEAQTALAPANGSRLAAELVAITAICQRPPGIEEGQLRDWTLGLMIALQRHPGVVAIAAIRDWPQQPGGRWWPMAADLDALARSIGAAHAKLASCIADAKARRRARQAPERSVAPIGRSAEFVDRIRAVHGEKFVRSWFVGGVNAQFSDTVVWLTPLAAEKIIAEFGAIVGEIGVRICADPDLSVSLARYCDARGLAA